MLAKELNETKGEAKGLNVPWEQMRCSVAIQQPWEARRLCSSGSFIKRKHRYVLPLAFLSNRAWALCVAARMRSAFIDFPSHFLWSKTSRTCYRSSSRRCSSSIHQLSLHLGLAAYSALQWILYMLVYYIAARLWKNNGGSQNAWHYLHMTISCRTALCMH